MAATVPVRLSIHYLPGAKRGPPPFPRSSLRSSAIRTTVQGECRLSREVSMKVLTTYRHRWMIPISLSLFLLMCVVLPQMSPAQDREHADEIVAPRAGGRVKAPAARATPVFAARK